MNSIETKQHKANQSPQKQQNIVSVQFVVEDLSSDENSSSESHLSETSESLHNEFCDNFN